MKKTLIIVLLFIICQNVNAQCNSPCKSRVTMVRECVCPSGVSPVAPAIGGGGGIKGMQRTLEFLFENLDPALLENLMQNAPEELQADIDYFNEIYSEENIEQPEFIFQTSPLNDGLIPLEQKKEILQIMNNDFKKNESIRLEKKSMQLMKEIEKAQQLNIGQ